MKRLDGKNAVRMNDGSLYWTMDGVVFRGEKRHAYFDQHGDEYSVLVNVAVGRDTPEFWNDRMAVHGEH